MTTNQPKSSKAINCQSKNERDRLSETLREIKARRHPYSCRLCKISFKHLSTFHNHITKHVLKGLQLSPFPCELCEQSFDSYGFLETHMRSHTGEKPHKCSLCPKRFAQKGHMKRHLKMLHTLEKPNKCEFCTKAFARRDDLTRHTWIHSNENSFNCDHCSETFKTPNAKRHHFNTHHKIP